MASYEVNYEDERFSQVEADKNAALKESNATYDDMINKADSLYNTQADAVKQWGDKQAELQQQQTDFTIEKIEQSKEQADKDYQKEGAAAYADWQKQSNQFGTNAEQMAQSGLASTGYSETSQVRMYTAYQQRLAVAKESHDKVMMNYNNAITEAQLQNNSVLAELAFNTMQRSTEFLLEGFRYKNDLINQKATAQRQIEDTFYSRYQDVVSQINTENSMAEQIRQYNESMNFDKQKFEEQQRQYEQDSAFQQAQFKESKRQYNKNLAEEQRQYDTTLAWQKEKEYG